MIQIPQSYNDLLSKDAGKSCTTTHCLKLVSVAELPSQHGDFIALAFQHTFDTNEHVALVKGDVIGQREILCRIHSECLTGDAFGSLRCDCREQLEGALQKIERENLGILIYLRQEGRGIGLTNKLRAYALQDKGYNTVEANEMLGLDNDYRTYDIAAKILQKLQIQSIRLLTNNPDKIQQLENAGVHNIKRETHEYKANNHNEYYLQTKKIVNGHLLDLATK